MEIFQYKTLKTAAHIPNISHSGGVTDLHGAPGPQQPVNSVISAVVQPNKGEANWLRWSFLLGGKKKKVVKKSKQNMN